MWITTFVDDIAGEEFGGGSGRENSCHGIYDLPPLSVTVLCLKIFVVRERHIFRRSLRGVVFEMLVCLLQGLLLLLCCLV